MKQIKIGSARKNVNNRSVPKLDLEVGINKSFLEHYDNFLYKDDVNLFACELLNLTDQSSPIATATDKQLAMFKSKRMNFPSLEGFVLDLRGNARDKWNNAAARVFAKEFVKSGRFSCKDEAVVRKAFTTYFVTLKKHYVDQVNLANVAYRAKVVKERSVNAASHRRRNVSGLCCRLG